MELRDLRDTWNELGRRDAMWAVLSGPLEARRAWDPAAFFQTGVDEVNAVLGRVRALGVTPRLERALDFGCGIGRLSQALAAHFAEVDGVDIAAAMLEQAQTYNVAGARCRFHLNEQDSLALFPDDSFDFLYSSITLQHMDPRFSRRFLREFFRVVRPGGVVVFQIPSEVVATDAPPHIVAQPLPDAAFRAAIEAPPELTCAPGARVRVPVRVRNLSPHTWPSIGEPDGRLSVRLANHWRHRFGWMVRFDDVRAALANDLLPGDEVLVDLVFEAPASGVHLLELDMVQEGVSWFEPKGSATTRLRVRVDSSLSGDAAIGVPRRMDMFGIPRPEVEALVAASGGAVLAADPDDAPGPGWTSFRYFTRRL
jgi:SAM-dependent methyltransferase